MTRALPVHVQKILKKHAGLQLDVGCGSNKKQGFVGMDHRRIPGVDIVHDITVTPWPLPDNCVHMTTLTHVWEHIPPWRTLDVMAEIHRVSKRDALLLMSGPYGNGARYLQDPTHCNPSTEATFLYWDKIQAPQLWNVYQPPVLHLEQFEIVPANGDRDFEVALRVCKGRCTHGG